MEKSHINAHYSKQDIQNLINKNNCLDSNKLRKTTLTTQLAYNIFYEIKEIPKCSGCQKDLRFGSFKTGYGTCGNRSCPLEKAKTKARKQIGISQKQYIDVICEKCGKISKSKQHNQKVCHSCVKIIKKEDILKNTPPSSIEKLKEVINSFLDEERRPDSWNEVLQKRFPDVFVLAHNFKEENPEYIKTLNQGIYHLFYELDEVPKCKGCGALVSYYGFLDGYNQFCPKTSCQWVDEKDKQKRLDSIAKTFNNRRIDNNVGEYSYINFNYKNMKYANRKFGANKCFITEFESLEEFDDNVKFLDFLDPLDFSNRYYCYVNNITEPKSCPTCSSPVYNVRSNHCTPQCSNKSLIRTYKIMNTKLQKYGPNYVYLPFKMKDYILPSGELIKYQGYENFLLDYLFKKYKEEDVITSVEPIPYIENGINRNYFPDAATKDNAIYEVKGEYTFKQGIEDGSIYLKSKAAVEKCDKFNLIVYSDKGEILEKYEFTKNNLEDLEKLKNIF